MNSPEERQWLIVGLGNPGERYELTRHNLGFMVVDLLARRLQTRVRREECRALVGRGELAGSPVELVKPQTFMNLSGESVSCLLEKPDRAAGNLIVVVDDIALPLGRIRIRRKGSDGGHNGLKSVARCLRTDEFIRLRIGIKPDHPVSDQRRFVLENFASRDLETVAGSIKRGADAVAAIIAYGVEKAMAEFNSDAAVDKED